MSSFQPTAATYRHGARTMPGEYYTSDAIFAEERERIFAARWNCVGRATSLAGSGDYLVREIAGESLIVVRDPSGRVRAFFNVCRHRGTRLCTEAAGHFTGSIQCPYHAWTYSLDGRLIGAPHMQEAEGFDKGDYPLHEAAVAEWEGFLFVHPGPQPARFESEWGPVWDRLRRYGLPRLVVGHRVHYDVRANWKLVFQNYSECLHCPTLHPKLATVLPYESGANDLTEGAFLGGYMEIRAPNQSATMSGRACGLPVSDALPADDRHRAYYYTLLPNLLLSLHPDYVNYYLLHPIAADRTVIESEWLFHPDTLVNSANNIQDAIEFWDVTNRQDWHIVERSQLGVASSRYVPGPYSPRESIPAAWDREYLRVMGRA